MKQIGGWWLPDSERHMGPMLAQSKLIDGRGTYQLTTLAVALKAGGLKRESRAIDVGAHVGLWTYHLAKIFRQVEAFEPVPEFRECLKRNVKAQNVTIRQEALGAIEGRSAICFDTVNTGATRLEGTDGHVPVMPLDAYGFEDVGIMKIDTEGFELFVVQGARATILRCKPVMIVEQKGGHAHYGIAERLAAVEELKGMGAKVLAQVVDDFILGWE